MAETLRSSGKALANSTMSIVLIVFVCGGIVCAAFSGRMQEVSNASFESAKNAVTLALSLVGIMAFWLGLMRVLEAGGLVQTIARWVKPLMIRLFPEIPPDHPAMGAMLLNISANMLGLGNAATPFGLRAMAELQKLNRIPGVATNSMCLFLAINTSSVTLLPLGVIGVRAAAGALNPANIFLPTLFATTCSTVAGVAAALYMAKRDRRYRDEVAAADGNLSVCAAPSNQPESVEADYSSFRGVSSRFSKGMSAALLLAVLCGLIVSVVRHEHPGRFLIDQVLSFWLMPVLMLLILCYGLVRGVRLYDALTDGAKQGFDIAVRIIPFLVTILVAVGMFRASGAMDLLIQALTPVTGLIGMPADVLPVALLRPLSGNGAFAAMSEVIQKAPNSYESFLASTIQGSTETTFYVLAVYFGSIGITRVRHSVWAGIIADVAGALGACAICAALWPA